MSEHSVEIMTKYLRKFVNSLGAMFVFVFGFFPFFLMIGSFIYPVFRVAGVIGRDDPWSPWILLIFIPLIALLMTFGDKLMKITTWCWDNADELTKKVKD